MPSNLPPPQLLPPDWLAPDWPPLDQSPTNQLPPDTPPILINHHLQVYLPTPSIIASKCISEYTQSGPTSACPNSLNHSLDVHLWVHSISQSANASPESLNPGVEVHLWVHSISVSKVISNHAQSLPSSTSSGSNPSCAENKGNWSG